MRKFLPNYFSSRTSTRLFMPVGLRYEILSLGSCTELGTRNVFRVSASSGQDFHAVSLSSPPSTSVLGVIFSKFFFPFSFFPPFLSFFFLRYTFVFILISRTLSFSQKYLRKEDLFHALFCKLCFDIVVNMNTV